MARKPLREIEMKIMDFETGRTLNDVCVTLSRDEAEELCAYLSRLTARPDVGHVHLTELDGSRVHRELAVALKA